MKIVIIEDELPLAKNLAFMLKQLDEKIEILATIDSVSDAISWFKFNEADLAFMDIQLSDGNSFSIFNEIEIECPVIFTTAYDKYAIDAFKVWSIDYLLKPISLELLNASIQKFKSIENKFNSIKNNELSNALAGLNKQFKKRFLVNFGDKIQTVFVERIHFFFIQGRDVFLCADDGKKYSVDYSLDQLESILNPEDFFRINRKYLINIIAIKSSHYLSPGKIGIRTQHADSLETIVSMSKTSKFKKWLNL